MRSSHLLSVLSGTFRRHGSFVRPLVAVGRDGGAAGRSAWPLDNLAARDNAMLPLMWLHAVVPGVICGWLLFGPQLAACRAAIRDRGRLSA